MSEQHVMAALMEVLPDARDQAILKNHKAGSDIALTELDLTSLRMVEVCMHLEQSMGVDIDIEEFEDAKMLSDLVNLCRELQSA